MPGDPTDPVAHDRKAAEHNARLYARLYREFTCGCIWEAATPRDTPPKCCPRHGLPPRLKLEEQLAAKAAECERLRKALQDFLAWVDKFRLREMGKTSYTVWFELQPVAKKADTALEEWSYEEWSTR